MTAPATLLERFATSGTQLRSLPETQSRLTTLSQINHRLRTTEKSLLPIEEDARRIIGKRIVRWNLKQHWLTKDVALFQAGYTPLSIEPLRWRNEHGFPQFAIFSLYSPNCIFSVAVTKRGRSFPERSIEPANLQGTALLPLFDDVFAMLEKRVKFRRRPMESKLRARYQGIIPDSTRAKIVEAQKTRLFQELFIISEVDWFVSVVPQDPLVTGWDGQKLWFIDKFDTTPAEDLMRIMSNSTL